MQKIFKATPSGWLSIFAGQNNPSRIQKTSCRTRVGFRCEPPKKNDLFVDGHGSQAKFDFPIDLDLDDQDNLYVLDYGNNAIRKVTPKGKVRTLAGNFDKGIQDGLGKIARFYELRSIRINNQNILYVADENSIRKITQEGQVITFLKGVNKPEDNSSFYYPDNLVFDKNDNLYLSDQRNRIYRISPAGKVEFIAGSKNGYADGSGNKAKFNQIVDMDINKEGDLIVVECIENHYLRKVTPLGKVTTLMKFESYMNRSR
jgi:hypothetical protein